VLALGICLAWPFRKSAPQFAPTAPGDGTVVPISEAVTLQSTASPVAEQAASTTPVEQRHVTAMMTSAGDGVAAASETGFDVLNHPALAQQPRDEPPLSRADALPASKTRPAYATSPPAPTEETAWPEEVVHIVRNGDTLEKLAQHYLGDEGRALELFDLNRDQLTNPHLLPIGAELRVPVPPQREVD
jgi:nucleoid-associated protein YgaU